MATIDDKYCNGGSIEDMVSVFYKPNYSESEDGPYTNEHTITFSLADWGEGPTAAMTSGWASYVNMINYLNEAYPNMGINPCQFNDIQIIIWSICQACSAMDKDMGISKEMFDPMVECAEKLRKFILVDQDDDEPNPE